MNKEEAIKILNDYDINFERNTAEEVAEAHEMAIKALKPQGSENYVADLDGRSAEEIAEAFDMAIKDIKTIPSEDEKVIRISKGTLKVRTGRYVIYDVEWLKTHFNTTEAKLYGQPNEDCISRKAVLDGLASIAKARAKSDIQKSLMGRVMFFTEHLPSVTPQPSERTEERTEMHACDCISRQFMYDMGATCIAARNKDGDLVALGALDILPSANSQPKTGHWEWVQYESKPNFGNWHCSECHHILCGAIKGNPVKLPKYCPDCGSYNGGTKQ